MSLPLLRLSKEVGEQHYTVCAANIESSLCFHLRTCYCCKFSCLAAHLSEINRRAVFTFVHIMHLYSWIVSGAVQVTTHPHYIADLHSTGLCLFPTNLVLGVDVSICDHLHLSNCPFELSSSGRRHRVPLANQNVFRQTL